MNVFERLHSGEAIDIRDEDYQREAHGEMDRCRQLCFEINAAQNTICKSLKDMLPLTMKLSRSGGHEYYASLPQDLNVTDAESTSHVKAGWLYYFKEWNAFALNFKEMDIAPYKVYVIAEISGGIENTLQDAPGTIEIRVLE